MALPKKLTCADVENVFKMFLDGNTVKSIAEKFNVTRLTISRVLRNESYHDCTKLVELPENFFKEVDQMIKNNQRRSMGRGKKGIS